MNPFRKVNLSARNQLKKTELKKTYFLSKQKAIETINALYLAADWRFLLFQSIFCACILICKETIQNCSKRYEFRVFYNYGIN